jgi:hypothetical protein
MGIHGNKEGQAFADLQRHLAQIHSTHCAMPDGNGYTCRCRQQFDRRSDHAAHVAALQAEVLVANFDMFPKGELHIETDYVEGEWGFGARDQWRWVSNTQNGVPDEQTRANYFVRCMSSRPS